jgi:hypothetical protein
LRPANTSACLFNLSLFHLHSRTHFENLSLYAAACLCCLAACPSVRLKDRPPVRRFRAVAPPPLLGQCYCYCVRYCRQLRTSCAAPRYRLLAACFLCKLYFAHDCPTFPLHCLARASSKEDKRRTQLHGLERALFLHPTSTSALGRKKKPARSCRSQKNYHFCPFAFNRLISQPAAAANAAAAR